MGERAEQGAGGQFMEKTRYRHLRIQGNPPALPGDPRGLTCATVTTKPSPL